MSTDKYSTEIVKVGLGDFPTVDSIVQRRLASILDDAFSLSGRFEENFKMNENQRNIQNIINTTQVDIDRTLFLLVYGNPGSGKTWGVLAIAWRQLCIYPEMNAIVVRKTGSQLLLGPFEDSIKILNMLGIPYKASRDKSDIHIRLPNGSCMYFKSDEALKPSAGTAVAHALGGLAFSIGIFEEVSALSEEVFSSFPGRLRQPGVFRRLVFCVCNPPDEDHWVYRWFFGTPDRPIDNQSLDSIFRAIQCNADKNEFRRKGYLEDQKEAYQNSPGIIGSLGDGEFSPAVAAFPVFGKSFSVSFHATDQDLCAMWNKRYPIVRGWDFGFHGNACILIQDDWDRKQIRIMKCFFEKFSLLTAWAKDVLMQCEKLFPGAKFEDYCDIAGNQMNKQTGRTDIDELRALGVRNPMAKKSAIRDGINLIDKLLQHNRAGRPYLLIDKKNARKVFQAFSVGYCYDKVKFDEIVKDGNYDHIMDALRYAMIHIRSLDRPVLDDEFSRPTTVSMPKTVRRSFM